MEIDESVKIPVKCHSCKCNSYMNNIKVRKLNQLVYLLKGKCIVCYQQFHIKLDDSEYRDLKIQIVLDSE